MLVENQKSLQDVEESRYTDRRKNSNYDSTYYNNANSTFDKRMHGTETDNMVPTPNNLQPKLLSNRQSAESAGESVSRTQSQSKTNRAASDNREERSP